MMMADDVCLIIFDDACYAKLDDDDVGRG